MTHYLCAIIYNDSLHMCAWLDSLSMWLAHIEWVIIFNMSLYMCHKIYHDSLYMCRHIYNESLYIQPIADRVALNLEITSKNFQFNTRRIRILMGFLIYYLVLIENPMSRILVRWKSLRNNLETLCHPICNWQ